MTYINAWRATQERVQENISAFPSILEYLIAPNGYHNQNITNSGKRHKKLKSGGDMKRKPAKSERKQTKVLRSYQRDLKRVFGSLVSMIYYSKLIQKSSKQASLIIMNTTLKILTRVNLTICRDRGTSLKIKNMSNFCDNLLRIVSFRIILNLCIYQITLH